MTTFGSIIIAAHNEQTVIGRSLRLLEDVLSAGSLDVVVVCNGCSDATAEVARGFPGVRVLELPVPSKTEALRAGEQVAGPGPRIYLDADVELTGRAALATVRALEQGAVAGRPPHRFDTRGASWVVRRWYAVRERLPSIQTALWGAGCYALSVRGRARFGEFPEVIADDLVIDRLFDPDEVVIVATDPVVVRTPRRTADLLRILRRSYRSQHPAAVEVHRRGEVQQYRPTPPRPSTRLLRGPLSRGQRGQLQDLGVLVRQEPWRVGDVVLYAAVVTWARIGARLPRAPRWERDDSSRTST